MVGVCGLVDVLSLGPCLVSCGSASVVGASETGCLEEVKDGSFLLHSLSTPRTLVKAPWHDG